MYKNRFKNSASQALKVHILTRQPERTPLDSAAQASSPHPTVSYSTSSDFFQKCSPLLAERGQLHCCFPRTHKVSSSQLQHTCLWGSLGQHWLKDPTGGTSTPRPQGAAEQLWEVNSGLRIPDNA